MSAGQLMSDGAQRLGRLGIASDVLLAATLAVFVQGNAGGHLDFAPRSLALLALYTAPGLVATCGLLGRRRSFVLAAALALVPGSVLSMAGVTLVFVLPIVLLAASAASLGSPRTGPVVEIGEALVAIVLLVAAGVAMLGLTTSGCSADGATCGSGLLTVQGLGLELALQAIAIAFAAGRSGLARRLVRRSAS